MVTSFDIDITWSPLTKIIVYQFLMLATVTEIKGRSPQLSVSTLYIDVDRKLQRTGLFVSVLVCLWHHLQRDLLVEKKKKIPRSLKETKKCFNFIIPKVKSNLPNSCLYSFFFAWLVFFFFRNWQPAKRAIRDKIMNPQLLSSISLHQPGRVMVSQLLLLSEWMIHE